MKKTLPVLLVVLLAGACASTGGGGFSTRGLMAWDESVPDEESAVIYFWGYNPTAYNGVSWTLQKTPSLGRAA
ncbi:MAG: hypothetical protein LBC31_07830, partial [Treponema sp.]|nr:hypothetical protein [Treponema sp.]